MPAAPKPLSNVFAAYLEESWPYRFECTLQFEDLVMAGIPADDKKAEAWLKTKLAESDAIIQNMVAQTMAELNVSATEAVDIVNKKKHLCKFKKDEQGLFIDGRQLKAMLKEAAVAALSTGKIANHGWGLTGKSLKPFIAEHVFVAEQRLHLHEPSGQIFQEPSGTDQRFVHVFNGNGIAYSEYCREAYLDFRIDTDHPFTRRDWGIIFNTGGKEGLGACRSLSHGQFVITKFDQVLGKPIPESGSAAKEKK